MIVEMKNGISLRFQKNCGGYRAVEVPIPIRLYEAVNVWDAYVDTSYSEGRTPYEALSRAFRKAATEQSNRMKNAHRAFLKETNEITKALEFLNRVRR